MMDTHASEVAPCVVGTIAGISSYERGEILTTLANGHPQYSQFTDEDIEVQRCQVTWLRSHRVRIPAQTLVCALRTTSHRQIPLHSLVQNCVDRLLDKPG